MDKHDVSQAYSVLSSLALLGAENMPRYVPIYAPNLNENVLAHLVEKEFVTNTNGIGGHIMLTPLGRQKAELMTRAIDSLLSFDWAERLPRVLAKP